MEAAGGKVSMEVVFHNEDAWPQEYMLIFGAFGGEDGKTLIKSKGISKPDDMRSAVSVTLNGLNEQTKAVSIAVVNKGREPIYEFYSFQVDGPDKEFTLPVKEIDLARFDRVQRQVFDAYCIRCHGAGTSAAAGLNLTEAYSRKALVGQLSALSEDGTLLVSPAQPSRSFLPEILNEDILQYNHTDVLPEAELIDLIEAWIKGGASE
jgi:hypothetical protein